MDEATDRLAEADTGGETIAAQTEIIEKIHAAAKEKQSQGGGGKSGGAMMDMMERMMGKKPEGEQPQKGQGDQAERQGWRRINRRIGHRQRSRWRQRPAARARPAACPRPRAARTRESPKNFKKRSTPTTAAPRKR